MGVNGGVLKSLMSCSSAVCYLERMEVLEYVLFVWIYSVSVVLGLRIKWEPFQLLCRGSKEVRQLVVEIFVLIFDVFLVFCLSEGVSMKQWLVGCWLLLVIPQLVGSLGVVDWLVVAVFWRFWWLEEAQESLCLSSC